MFKIKTETGNSNSPSLYKPQLDFYWKRGSANKSVQNRSSVIENKFVSNTLGI